jgi:hypothetical protein
MPKVPNIPQVKKSILLVLPAEKHSGFPTYYQIVVEDYQEQKNESA